jgi:S1-C subfamily serine protease
LFAFGVFGCASGVRVKSVAQLEPLPARRSSGTRVVELRKLVIRVPVGGSVGALRSGLGCVRLAPLTAVAGRAFLGEGELAEVFRSEFSSVGYAVADDRNALFEEASEARPDYLIGGIVHDVRANLCSHGPGFGTTERAKGEASLAVDWQVFSLRTRKVEFSATSVGAARLERALDSGGFEVFQQAFRVAARNLLANPRLREVLEGPSAAEGKSVAEEEPIVVAFETAGRGKNVGLETMLSDARLSVVTIIAGEAFGSGFLISSDGYLLTSQHVVGKARYVTARFVTGREVNGEVVRADADRDVALVKLENDRYRPLALGHTRVLKPGADVFAIGTPLSEEFGQSVSKGIISGFGEDDGQRMIRSDVRIHKGNSGGPLLVPSGEVVGIAEGGVVLMPLGAGVGLNSFIPIEEAIEVLGIRNRQGSRGSAVQDASQRNSPGN